MKKILKLSLTVFIILCIMMLGNVYAVSNNVNMQSTKTEVKKDEEFTITVSLSNLQTETGIIAFSTVLEYDKPSLELKEMKGLNGWENPREGTTYNPETGNIAITRDSVGKSDEAVFNIAFKVKSDNKENATISLKNVMVADGKSVPSKTDIVQKSITIKKEEVNPTPDNPTPDNPTPDNPTPDKPTPDEPTPDDQTSDKPTQDNPTPDDQTPDEPTPDNPTPDEPTPDKPTQDDPTPDDQTPDNPTPDKPTQDEPKPDNPKLDNPTQDEPKPNNSKPDKPSTNNSDTNTSKIDNTVTPNKILPQTGETNYIWIIIIGVLIILSIVVFIKIKANKK